ncbi:hypothetical protein DFJ73DRAFT_820931 [Zopfochytrium polystomum]|nr:hypothetical protein DFJ73DRAFT_820931 [Zopfochytrium polystomum]
MLVMACCRSVCFPTNLAFSLRALLSTVFIPTTLLSPLPGAYLATTQLPITAYPAALFILRGAASCDYNCRNYVFLFADRSRRYFFPRPS